MCNKNNFVAHMVEIKHHSHVAAAAYIDLKRSLADDAAADITGTIERRERNGRIYLYERLRQGRRSIARYIGEANPELEARISAAEKLRAKREIRRKEQMRLVRTLRAEGIASLDTATGQVIAAFAKSGLFRLGGTLIGTVAFRLYEGELGVAIGYDQMAQTGDIDIASFERLSLALDDVVSDDLANVMQDLDFVATPSLDRNRTWRWRHATKPADIEFLTPAFGEEGLRDLPALGVSAQALHHLNFLIADPIKAVAFYRSGVLVQIPRPEAFAFHKLIVADRRKGVDDALKARKDRAQADFLIAALAQDRPDELLEAWEDARARGPKWRARIDASLVRMPEARARLRDIGAEGVPDGPNRV